jgi:hypothetical protein
MNEWSCTCAPLHVFCRKVLPQPRLSRGTWGQLSGELRYQWNNRTCGASKIRIPPQVKEFPRKSSEIWPTVLKTFASPVPDWKSLKNIGLKERHIIILPRKPTCLLPTLTTVLCIATVHTLLSVTVFMFKYYKHGDVTRFFNSTWQLPSRSRWQKSSVIHTCPHFFCAHINVLRATHTV